MLGRVVARGQPLLLHPLLLQAVLAVEGHHGGAANGFGADPVRKMPRHKRGAGRGHVAHRPQRPGIAARNAARAGRDGGQHVAFLDALGCMVLVVDADVQQFVAPGGEGRHGIHEPGGQRIGIHRQLQRGGRGMAVGHQARVGAAQFVFEQRHLLHMQAQPPPGVGAGAGGAAQHQHLARALFQLLDALRHCRGCDVQSAGRPLEAAFPHHGGQGLESGVIQHEELLTLVQVN